MRFASIAIVSLALVACQAAPENTAESTQPQVPALEGASYGEPLTLTEVTAVSSILGDPVSFVGERVLIEGEVTEVCKMQGCWLEVVSGEADDLIRVKVDDGVIVFPLTSRGKKALVEGTVEELQLTYEQAVARAEHEAEELGEEFDLSAVPEGPQTIYRIRGIGAVIAQ